MPSHLGASGYTNHLGVGRDKESGLLDCLTAEYRTRHLLPQIVGGVS